MVGKDKIPVLLINKSQELIDQLIPTIIQIASQVGIENIGQPNEKLPNTCLPKDELEKILIIRNNLLTKLNNTSKLIETLSKPLDILNTTVKVTSTLLTTTSIARKASNVAIAAIPSPPGTPGAIISTLNVLKDLEEFITPKIQLAKNSVTSISNILDYVNSILSKLIILLKSIDKYLLGCNVSGLVTLNEYLTKVDENYNQIKSEPTNKEIYQGFILEVVEEPFSPTVSKRKAVAKNSQGIILLSTPSSFTTIPQILLTELKLIIDKNNLKAN